VRGGHRGKNRGKWEGRSSPGEQLQKQKQ
jgi:hypothetical protein